MPFVWIGLIFVLLKWQEIGPFANLAWWWVLAPLAIAFVWFECLEKFLGLDKRKEDTELEDMKKARVKQAFEKEKRRA